MATTKRTDKVIAELMTLDGATQYMLLPYPPPETWQMAIHAPIKAGFWGTDFDPLVVRLEPIQHRDYELYHVDEENIWYYREVAP